MFAGFGGFGAKDGAASNAAAPAPASQSLGMFDFLKKPSDDPVPKDASSTEKKSSPAPGGFAGFAGFGGTAVDKDKR